MNFTEEQITEFRKQVITQIESTFPEEKKATAIESINSMNDEDFIGFLRKNNLLGEDSSEESGELNQNETPFRLIIEGKIPSYSIDENEDCLAVLEIKPISKAHTIIIPKKPVHSQDKLPKSLLTLAKKISKKIETKFKPKNILVSPSTILGEIIINIIPVYSDESLDSPRTQASKEELEDLKNTLEAKQKPKSIKKPRIKKIKEQNIWLPNRIP